MRPHSMQVVDHESVAMLASLAMVTFRPMGIVVGQFGMVMIDLVPVGRRPDRQGDREAQERDGR